MRDMRAIALCLGLAGAAAIHAGEPVQAKLVGQRLVSSFPGTPVLVCRYAGPEARYEVVAAAGACAPYLELSDESESLARPAGTLARTPSP
jgi:hypothetical protein